MSASLQSQLGELTDTVQRIINGEFPQRTPLGPGNVSSNNIKSKNVRAGHIDVSDLQSVNSNTGNLTVSGRITVGDSGDIISATSVTDITTTTWAQFTGAGGAIGYFLEYNGGSPRMALGDFENTTGNYLKWDGSTLSIKGVLTASVGSIGGWTIVVDRLYSGTYPGDVGLASSGTWRLWSGGDPASVSLPAKFRVDNTGAMWADTATITGSVNATAGNFSNVFVTGNLNVSTGAIRSSGVTAYGVGTGFWLGRDVLTYKFRVGDPAPGGQALLWDGSSMTVQGAINATSGNFTGTVTLSPGSTTSGIIKSSGTNYNSGPGFWLGYYTPSGFSDDPGYRFYIGDGANNKLLYDGTHLSVRGIINADSGYLGTLDVSGVLTLTDGGYMVTKGKTGYAAGSGVFLGYDALSTTYRMDIGSALRYVRWDGSALSVKGDFVADNIDANAGTLGTLTVDGAIMVNTLGSIQGGKTSYADSTHNGFWLGYDPSNVAYSFSIGSPTQALLWNGTTMLVQGTINATAGFLQNLTVSGAISLNTVNGSYIGSGKTDYAQVAAGFFLGRSGGFTKFDVGSSTSYLRWDGGGVIVKGDITCDTIDANSGTIGNLTVDGAIALTSVSGSAIFTSGKSSYASTTGGFWMGYDPSAGSYRLNIGDSANYLKWTGTGVQVKGDIAADTGTLSNLTVNGTLTLGNASTLGGKIRSWDGAGYLTSKVYLEATPSGSLFSLGNKLGWDGTTLSVLGAISATSMSLTGALTFGPSGSIALPGVGSITQLGMDVNQATFAGITVDGTMTLSAVGPGKIIDGQGSVWDNTGITLFSPSINSDTIKWKYSGWAANRPYTSLSGIGSSAVAGLGLLSKYGNGAAYSAQSEVNTLAQSGLGLTTVSASVAALGPFTQMVVRADSTPSLSRADIIVEDAIILRATLANSRVNLYGRLYPGNAGSLQSSRYLEDNGTSFNLATMPIGDSAGNWTTNKPTNSAYLLVYINGIPCRIPFYANA